MIDLREYREPVWAMVETGLASFCNEHSEAAVGHVALYCCPWSGWVCLSINSTPVSDEDFNCPDFEFHEYASFDADEWAEEYEEREESLQIISLDGHQTSIDLDDDEEGGDEALNQAFLPFLKEIMQDKRAVEAMSRVSGPSTRVGVQMLDSECQACWNLALK